MNQDTENLKDKQTLLLLLIQAQKAVLRVDFLKHHIKYFEMLYAPDPSFHITDFEINVCEYIENLKKELKEEQEFVNHVVRHYCTNQDASCEARELPKVDCVWGRNTN